MTYLQLINTTLKENIKIPLSTFYKIVLLIIVILFIALMLLAVPSFWKFSSILGLFFLFITTSLLFYGNYQEEQINNYFSEFENIKVENINEKNEEIEIIELGERSEEIEKIFVKNESEINKNFIA